MEHIDGFAIEYTRSNHDTDTILILSQSTSGKWCWVLEDLVAEGEVNSSAHMFDTPQLAAEAALKYYNEEWLPEYQENGSREGPLV